MAKEELLIKGSITAIAGSKWKVASQTNSNSTYTVQRYRIHATATMLWDMQGLCAHVFVHVWMYPCTQQSARLSTLCMSDTLQLILPTQLNHNTLLDQPKLFFLNKQMEPN